MRILWITNTPSNASSIIGTKNVSGNWITKLEEYLQKEAEISLAVAFLYHGNSLRKIELPSITYYAIPTRSNKFKRYFKRLSSRNIKIEKEFIEGCIRDFNPDIIQLFGTEKAYWLNDVHFTPPLIIYVQGIISVVDQFWFGGLNKWHLIFHYDKLSWLKGSHPVQLKKLNFQNIQSELELFQRCNYIIGRTEWDRKVSNILSKRSKYFQCHELLRDKFYRVVWTYPESKTDVITLISIVNRHFYKGLDLIIRTLGLLIKNYKINWKIVGLTGKENETLFLMRECNNLDIICHSSIEFLGILTEDLIINEFLKSHIYIHPSYIDNSPNSLCEAMLIGMPVIATNVGGISTLIEHNVTGILTPSGDYHSLSGCIMELYNNKDLMNLLSNNARKIALERHHHENIIKSYINLYKNIDSKRNPAD